MRIRKFIIVILLVLALLSYMILAMRDFTVFAVLLFWDLKAFLMIVIIPSLILLITYTPKEIALYIYTVLYKEEKQNDTINKSINFFKRIQRLIIYSGVFIFFFSIMMMLSDISSVSVIARNSATGLCGIIYALLFVILIILPIQNSLEKRVENLNKN